MLSFFSSPFYYLEQGLFGDHTDKGNILGMVEKQNRRSLTGAVIPALDYETNKILNLLFVCLCLSF